MVGQGQTKISNWTKFFQRFSLEQKIVAGFGLALATLLAVGAVQYRATQALIETDREVAHTHAVLAELEGVFGDMEAAESSGRGYVATGDYRFVRPRDVSISICQAHLLALRKLFAGDSRRQGDLDGLVALAERKVAFMRQLIVVRRDQGLPAAIRLMHDGEGVRLMTEIRELIEGMEAEENGSLQARQAASRASARNADAATVLGMLLALVFGVLAARIAHRDIVQRQRAEASRARLAAIVESSDDAIIGKTLDGIIQSWNAGAERLYGYSAEEVKGKPVSILLPPDRPDEEQSILKRIEEGEKIDHYETERVTKDGRLIHVSLTVSPIRDETGKVVGASAIARDITGRKRAEATLKESEERFRLLLDSTAEAIYGLDVEGRCTFCNPAGLGLLGYSDPSQVLGKDLHALTHHQHADGTPYPAVDCKIQRALGRDEEAHLQDEVFWRADGTSFAVEAWSHPIRHGASVVGCVVTFLDITERRQAEEALRRAGTYNRRLIEASLDPLVTIAPDGKVTDVNRATEKVTGLSREVLVGTDFSDYFTDPAKARAGYEQVFREGWVQDYELAIRHREGQITPVLYNASVYSDDSGNVIGVFAAARDISERKRAEHEVRKLNEELEQRVAQRTAELEASNKELEAFTYSVSHDLRAPLRHIDGFSKMLEEETGALPGEAKRFVKRIRDGTRQMGELVDDLLNLARLGRKELSLQVAGLSTLVEEAADELKKENTGRSIKWKIANLPFVECDPGLMKQVFVNLLSNAVKYTRPRPEARIEVGSFSQDGQPVIFVRDNGVGFSMKYADKLFGVFQRLRRAEDFEGTGIGLATVQRILHRHGGRAWTEAELDKGATFYFTLGKQETEDRSQKTEGGEVEARAA